MAVPTEIVAMHYLNVVANVAISVPIKCYDAEHVIVLYGNAGVPAARGADYSVTLQPDDYDLFLVTPTPALIAKIEALMLADPTEVNRVVVRRELGYTTDITPETAQYRQRLSQEADLTIMRFQQLADVAERAIVLPPNETGNLTLPPAHLRADRLLGFDADGQPRPTTITLAELEGAVEAIQGAEVDAIVSDARGWATNPVDALFSDSQGNAGFSSYHWAMKAAQYIAPAINQGVPHDAYIADGVSVRYPLGFGMNPDAAGGLLVTLDGVLQHLTAYAISADGWLEFTEPPEAGTRIQVLYIGLLAVSTTVAQNAAQDAQAAAQSASSSLALVAASAQLAVDAAAAAAQSAQDAEDAAASIGGGSGYDPAAVNITGGSLSGVQVDADTLAVGGTPLAAVALSGDYADLDGTPTLAPVATSGDYADLDGRPSLALVATTGQYADLDGKPTLGTAAAAAASDFATAEQGALAGTAVQPNSSPVFTAVNTAEVKAQGAGANEALALRSKGASAITLTREDGPIAFRAVPAASGVNYVQVNGAATGGIPYVSFGGTDVNVTGGILTKGGGSMIVWGGGGFHPQLQVTPVTNAVNCMQISGATTGGAPTMAAIGTDANIRANITAKGAEVVGLGNNLYGLTALVGTAFGADKCVLITNTEAAPSVNYTAGGILYVQNGALKYRGSSGTVTNLANA